jgi:Rod binding domain-containing protein
MSQVTPRVGSSLDFQGLGELRGQAQRDQRGALRETARQFEAMFIQTIMATMREAGFKSDLVESSAMETFQTMHDKEIALSMTRRGGLGFADMLVDQMERNKMVPAAQALAHRGALNAPVDPRSGTGADAVGLTIAPPAMARPLEQPLPKFKLPIAGPQSLPLQRALSVRPTSGGER